VSAPLAVTYEGITDRSRRLATAAADLGTWSARVPPAPASGAGARQAGAIATHLREQVAHLTRTIESAADALVRTRAAYEAVDERSRSRAAALGEAR
jgi:hypothetical protein